MGAFGGVLRKLEGKSAPFGSKKRNMAQLSYRITLDHIMDPFLKSWLKLSGPKIQYQAGRGPSRFRAVPFPPVGSGAPSAAAGTAQVVTLNGPFVQVRNPTLIVESADAVSFFLVAHGGPLRDTNR